MGVLSMENRKNWSSLRAYLSRGRKNASCWHVVVFIVCFDEATPVDLADVCNTFLCGTYDLEAGVQIGTCTNRWYDKVSMLFLFCFARLRQPCCRPIQIIVRGRLCWDQL